MPAVLAVLWVPLSAADTFPHPKSILVAGERFLEVMKRKSLVGRFWGFFVPINQVACTANMLKPAVQAVVCCFGHAIHACVQMAASVVCLPQTVCRGLWHRSLYVSDLGCRAWKKQGLYSRWVQLVLNRLWPKCYFNSLWQNCLSEKLIMLSSELTLISSVCMTLIITTCFTYLSV